MAHAEPPARSRSGTPRHRQIAVKVNAWADRGVAPLVEAPSAVRIVRRHLAAVVYRRMIRDLKARPAGRRRSARCRP